MITHTVPKNNIDTNDKSGMKLKKFPIHINFFKQKRKILKKLSHSNCYNYRIEEYVCVSRLILMINIIIQYSTMSI